jgi:hypothetical protein
MMSTEHSDGVEIARKILERAINRETCSVIISLDPETDMLEMMGVNADMSDIIELILQGLSRVKTIIEKDMRPDRTLQ